MNHIRIARVVNTFGIRGELRLLADTDFPEQRFEQGASVYLIKDGLPDQKLTVEQARANKGHYIISFQEIDNINQVESYKGGYLTIDSDQQEELAEGDYYYHQIIGLKVYTDEEELLGTIKDILELGSNDVWVVKSHKPGRKDILLPFIDDVIKEVDLETGKVQVELMEGLIDDEN
ncbi:ribosome maturation factor RimM [Hutsoniella sourekii]